jgi:hypothetical protein
MAEMKSQAKKLIDLIDSIIRKEKLLDEIMVFDAEKNEAHRIDEGKFSFQFGHLACGSKMTCARLVM